MIRFLFTLLLTVASVSAFAAAPAPSSYPYQARLNAAPVKTDQRVAAPLTTPVLSQLRPDFGNLQLVDDLNANIEFVVFDQPAGPVRSINTLNVSSADERTDPANLLDNNKLTPFGFDQKVDAENPATITIDFGKMVELHRIELWPEATADIKGMEIKYGVKKDTLRTLKRKTAFEPIIDGDFPTLRWLEISLWGSKVRLQDVNTFKRAAATVYFTAQPDRRYRLLFGDKSLDNKRFAARVKTAEKSDQDFSFAPLSFNKAAGDDFDADGVASKEDNCPTISNKNQADKDGDNIGDVCDNAKNVKNYSQSDIDGDGIADIIDNCKLAENADQKDKDKDGYGDECDGAYGKEGAVADSVAKATGGSSIPYAPIAIGLVVIAAAGFVVMKKKK